MLMETVVLDLPTIATPNHFAIRHKPSGRLLAWDDTLTPNVGEALRYDSLASCERRILWIEDATRGEFEPVGLKYQPAKKTVSAV